jgi:selenocysteine-specific elongation factor
LERGFSVQGYGTVVAGIPVAGLAHAGDEVVLLPQNLTGRIRRIEVYGQTADAVMAGQCAALNVGHWDHRTIHRGDTLTLPGFFAPAEWFVCSVRLLPRDKLLLKSGAEVRFHTGTSDVAAMFYPLQGNHMQGGAEGLMQVRTKTPIVAGPGDHFILRTLSPVRTIGGGLVVEAVSRRLKGSRPHVVEDLQARAEAIGDPCRFVEYCVRRGESPAVSESALAVRTKIPHARLHEILADLRTQQTIFCLPAKLYVHRDTVAELAGQILAMVGDFHRQSPESPGLPLDQLRRTLSLDKPVFDDLMARLKNEGRLVEQNGRLALPEHRSTFRDEEARLLEAVESLFREQLFSPPGIDEVVRQSGATPEKVKRALGLLREHGRLVPVAEGLMFHQEAVDRARELLLDQIRKEGRLESVDFKYLLGTTRKFALPMLDYLDRLGLTRRVGNTRLPKAKGAH